MTKIITVTNQKGGTGKTSTSLFTSYGLALKGYRVLLIDLDSQADASFSTGIQYDPRKTSLEVILGEIKADDAIVPVKTKKPAKLDLLPASPNLASLDIQLVKRQLLDAQYNLSEALKTVLSNYDYVVIDTPPAISMAVLNALTVSDYVIVPTQADIYGLKGLGNLANTIQSIRSRSNPRLRVLGILLGRYNARTKFTQAITNMLNSTSQQLNTKVFDTKIREAIVIKEAQGEQTNLFEYAPNAKATKDVNNFITELLGGLNND